MEADHQATPYQALTSEGHPVNEGPQRSRQPTGNLRKLISDSERHFSDIGAYVPSKKPRAAKKRVDVQTSIRESLTPSGSVWAVNVAGLVNLQEIVQHSLTGLLRGEVMRVDASYTEVLFCTAFDSRLCFVFKFGCIVGWDMTSAERKSVLGTLKPFMKDIVDHGIEQDDMEYVYTDYRDIRQDIIHLVSENLFEKLAYSYGFAQSVKLSYFETKVDDAIDRTKAIPEGIAKTGQIKSTREEISRRIGELFISRFYINLHTDILDTPDIFWEFDEYAEHYSSGRSYLEIPKRVDILNQRLDIIKDMYDMLNNELTIQHGYKLEWIVIYLICIEVVIEVFWNILVKDILHLV